MRVARLGRRRAVRSGTSLGWRAGVVAATEALERRLCLSGGGVSIQAARGPIGLGEARSGTITDPAQSETYTFHGTQGDLIRIAVADTRPYGLTAVAELFTQTGQMVGTQVGPGTEKPFTLPATQDYLIRVHDGNFSQAGPYSVGLDGIRPVAADAVAIGYGDDRTGSFAQGAQVDTYTFQGAAGDLVRVAVADTRPYGVNTVADIVRTSDGTIIKSVGPGTEQEVTLASTGLYVLRVHDDNFIDAGPYAVGLDGIRPVSADAVPIAYGEDRTGSLQRGAEVDTYTFQASAGDMVRVAVADTRPYGLSTIADVVRTTDGSIVKSVGPGTEQPVIFASGGVYVVRVHDDNFTDAGPYSVGLDGIRPVGADAVAIKYGDSRAASLRGAQVDTFTFLAAAGDLVRVAVADTRPYGLNVVADVVRGSDGSIVKSVGVGSEQPVTLSEAGLYVLRVHDDNFTDGGPYAVHLDGVKPVSPDAPMVQLGQAYDGQMDVGADVDTFTLAAEAGDVVRLAVADTRPYGIAAVGDLLRPDGQVVGSVAAGTAGNFTLQAGGTYLVRLHDDNFTDAGPYAFGIEGIRPSASDVLAIPPAESRSGSLGSAETHGYAFYAEQGDAVRLIVSDTRPFGIATVADLIGPAGTSVGRVTAGLQGQFPIPATGDYLLLVHDDNYTDAGPYAVSIDWATPLDGAVAGRVFDDLDGDGAADDGEPGIYGMSVFLDANGDGVAGPGERVTTTDMLGGYAFTSVAPGAYDVRQVLPAGWVRTAPAAGTYPVNVGLADSVVGRDFAVRPPAITRSVFYNNSAFDGRNPAANTDDDAAIVPAKRVLLPGQAAALADVTGYSKGLNGVMIDFPVLPGSAALTAEDFAFRASPELGSTENSPLWFPGPAPSSVTIRRGAGAGGSDRVTLVWPDFVQAAPAAGQAVANGWLEVTVKAGTRTGLAVADVFYFGNQIGDTGDSPTSSRVNALDLGAVKRLVNASAGIGSGVDVNHDGRVNALDLGIIKANLNRVLPMLSERASAASGTATLAAQAAAAAAAAGIVAPSPPAKLWDDPGDGVLA